MNEIHGKSILVRVSTRFKLTRVRIIGIHLLSQGKSLVSSEGGNFFQRYCLAIVFHPISNNFLALQKQWTFVQLLKLCVGLFAKFVCHCTHNYGYVKIERHTIVNLLGGWAVGIQGGRTQQFLSLYLCVPLQQLKWSNWQALTKKINVNIIQSSILSCDFLFIWQVVMIVV